MNLLPDPEDLHAATKVINQYASSDWVRWTYSKHARERQSDRVICNDLVELALREGVVVAVTKVVVRNCIQYRYEVEYRDRYGRLTVITALAGPHHLVIVSTYTDIPD